MQLVLGVHLALFELKIAIFVFMEEYAAAVIALSKTDGSIGFEN